MDLTSTQYALVLFFGVIAGGYGSVAYDVHRRKKVVTSAEEEESKAQTIVASPPPAGLKPSGAVKWSDSTSLVMLGRNFGVLGVILYYVWMCERNPLNPQGKRMESPDQYWFMVFLFFVVGLFTLKSSGTARVLHREQTNEWKGWMQYFFIAYHYFHAMYVYKPVRVLVSTYVWMTGFGNFFFFDKVGDFGLVRFLSVMWRLNFTTIFLLMALNNTYVLYYIVPLHTMYFLMVYGVMRIRKAFNLSTWFTLAATFAVIFVVWNIPGVFDLVFGWLDVFDGGVFVEHEWHFRTGLDQFSSLFGMAFAAVLPSLISWVEAWEASNVSPAVGLMVKGSVSFVLTGLACWWAYWFGLLPKTLYNSAHPFFVLVPIAAYILLRNLTKTLRSYHIQAFATLGTITLETYLLQHHVWLTSNAKTRLVLIPDWPMCNMLLTTTIFVACSKMLFEVTNNLRVLFVPKDNLAALRNVLGLLGVLALCGVGGLMAKGLQVGAGSLFTLAAIAGGIVSFSRLSHHGALPLSTVADTPAPKTKPAGAKPIGAGVGAGAGAGAGATPDGASASHASSGLTSVGVYRLMMVVAGLVAVLAVCLSGAHSIVEPAPSTTAAAADASTLMSAPTEPLPRLDEKCVPALNDGAWVPLNGAKAAAKAGVDPLQIGLSEAQERVWKWSFGASKDCGFGVKTTKATADAMQGRWVLFMGDSQPRSIFRRLATSVGPVLSSRFGEAKVNGEPVSDLRQYTFIGHRDLEVTWHSSSGMVTRLSFWWTPFLSNVTDSLQGTHAHSESRQERCSDLNTGQAFPDVIVASAGSWDVLHVHETKAVATSAADVQAAFRGLEDNPLCALADGASSPKHLQDSVPGVVWMTQPCTNVPRLPTPEKRERMTPDAIRHVNLEITSTTGVGGMDSPFAAVVDMFKITEPRLYDTADGFHFGDSTYNVAAQLVANAALGTATKMRCSTCKPTLTTVPGDPVLAVLGAVATLYICFMFYALQKYVMPKGLTSRGAGVLGL